MEATATVDTSPVRYAVVDVETSGLRPDRHRVLQVGVVVVDTDGAVLTRWKSLLRPRRRWWYRVGPVRIHGIHRRDVRDAPPAGDVLRRLAELLDGATVVAHNAGFDTAFLRRAAAREGVELPLGDTLCTLRLSRQLDPQRQLSHRLVDVAGRYGVTVVQPHDALADADATAAILPHLLRATEAQRASADAARVA
ncbi:MAG: exonuclease domain-containing protein [Ilumatobacteraceae bacterium]